MKFTTGAHEGKTRYTFRERELSTGISRDWILPAGLFRPNIRGLELFDFREEDYAFFLDNVRLLADLIRGLRALSPFADDALDVAESMTESDFVDFKLAIAYERAQAEKQGSRMPEQFLSLTIPLQFLLASSVAEKYQVDLGVALLQTGEMEAEG